jgi:NADP-dependent 3-hydroxy acid dehydrogenase YdfG
MKYRYAIVVGASSGMGREIARQLAEDGCRVAALARRLDRLRELQADTKGEILPFCHHVECPEDVPRLLAEITRDLGGLDLFVYAAGVMPPVEPDEYHFTKDYQTVQVNILGAIAWINSVAERMQATKHGSMVAIGSVAGDRGRMKQPVYNASKAFLHTYMEAIRNRVARYGVKVCTVKPGPTETEMTAHLHLKGAMPAPVAAAKIIRLSRRTGEFYLSWKHAVAFWIIRHIPSWIFRRLKI